MMMGTTSVLLPTYPTIPHMVLAYLSDTEREETTKVVGSGAISGRRWRMVPRCGSALLEAEGKFLYNGIGEDLAGDALDFGARGGFREAVVEGELKAFALADVGYAGVAHL